METKILRITECDQASGLCVVIDVLRAFTTAAFAFAAGASEIELVASPEEALFKSAKDSSLLLMGEFDGELIPGFHYGNSPSEIEHKPLVGRKLCQRTSSGTQGVVGCKHADAMLIASFVVAEATVSHIRKLNPSLVCFIVTGRRNGDEDLALAEYLEAKLLGITVSPEPYLERVRLSPWAVRYGEAGGADLTRATQIDRFAFAMQVHNENGSLIARRSYLNL